MLNTLMRFLLCVLILATGFDRNAGPALDFSGPGDAIVAFALGTASEERR